MLATLDTLISASADTIFEELRHEVISISAVGSRVYGCRNKKKRFRCACYLKEC